MDGYFMYDHHPEYENLTIEEKLLVDKEMKKWWASMADVLFPLFVAREKELRVIKEIKRKEKKWETN